MDCGFVKHWLIGIQAKYAVAVFGQGDCIIPRAAIDIKADSETLIGPDKTTQNHFMKRKPERSSIVFGGGIAVLVCHIVPSHTSGCEMSRSRQWTETAFFFCNLPCHPPDREVHRRASANPVERMIGY